MTARTPRPARVKSNFCVIIDSREQSPYTFEGLRANADRGGAIIDVPTVRAALPTGDYSIFGLPSICIERKTVVDFFGSVARRDNFEGRLARMSEFTYSAVIVEAEWSEILADPPRHSRMNVRALARTVMSWTQRYDTVHWWFMPGRLAGEATCYRLMELHFKRHKDEVAQS